MDFLTQFKGGHMSHLFRIQKPSISLLSIGLLSVMATGFTWAQPGAADFQTKTSSQLESKNNGNKDCIDSLKADKSKETPHFCLNPDDIFGEQSMSPWVESMVALEENLVINLDRSMTEYFVATLDRERIEFRNQEN